MTIDQIKKGIISDVKVHNDKVRKQLEEVQLLVLSKSKDRGGKDIDFTGQSPISSDGFTSPQPSSGGKFESAPNSARKHYQGAHVPATQIVDRGDLRILEQRLTQRINNAFFKINQSLVKQQRDFGDSNVKSPNIQKNTSVTRSNKSLSSLANQQTIGRTTKISYGGAQGYSSQQSNYTSKTRSKPAGPKIDKDSRNSMPFISANQDLSISIPHMAEEKDEKKDTDRQRHNSLDNEAQFLENLIVAYEDKELLSSQALKLKDSLDKRNQFTKTPTKAGDLYTDTEKSYQHSHAKSLGSPNINQKSLSKTQSVSTLRQLLDIQQSYLRNRSQYREADVHEANDGKTYKFQPYSTRRSRATEVNAKMTRLKEDKKKYHSIREDRDRINEQLRKGGSKNRDEGVWTIQ